MNAITSTGLRLNFACGTSRWDGFINADIHDEPGSEIVDLDETPYPFPDGSAELILISHGLCIRPNKRAILAEFTRILVSGGWLRIDDNPYRFWVDRVQRDLVSDMAWGVFPDELLCPRQLLMEWLDELGFDAKERRPSETWVSGDDGLRTAILGNQLGHESFTVEAQKR